MLWFLIPGPRIVLSEKNGKYKKIIDLPIDFFSAGIYIVHTTCESNAGMVELVDTLA